MRIGCLKWIYFGTDKFSMICKPKIWLSIKFDVYSHVSLQKTPFNTTYRRACATPTSFGKRGHYLCYALRACLCRDYGICDDLFFMINDLKGGQARVVITATAKSRPDGDCFDDRMAQRILSAMKKGADNAERTISAYFMVVSTPHTSTKPT